MSTRKLRTVENLIMLTFPLVLFAGCAGSDVKPVESETAAMTISEPQHKEIAFPASETEISQVTPIEPEVSPVENEIRQDEIELVQKTVDTENSTMPGEKIFFFDTDRYTLKEEQRQTLKQHADYLMANPESILIINGHADVRGTTAYNQTLSENRARETYQLLIELGVPETQLLSKGFGETLPMNDERNWEENRRVELQYTDPVMLSSM